MSRMTIQKTRRCSGKGKLEADTIAKGETWCLFNMGLSSASWLRPSKVLIDWVKKPTVTPDLGLHLLEEMSRHMEVIFPVQCDF